MFFFNGHARADLIVSESRNSADYKTGIYIGNDTVVDGITAAGLASTNMSSNKLIVFAGCKTGAWPHTENNKGDTNLPMRAVQRGSTAAVGFRKGVETRVNNGPNWLNTFNTSIKNGYGVDGAITAACMAYPNSSLSSCAMAEGNIYSVTVPVRMATFAESDLKSQYYTIKNEHIEIEDISEKIENEELTKYATKFNDIIEKIKETDATFDVNDYKVTYNQINKENGFAHLFFTKYINQKIETNKVYLTVIKNGKVDEIILADITKDKMRTKEENVDILNNKIEQFEQNKLNKLKTVKNEEVDLQNIQLGQNKKIEKNSISNNVEEVEEKYFYDYNTKELKYIMLYIEKQESNTESGNGIELNVE